MDVASAIRQVEVAKQKLELYQEKLQLESELLKSDKRTWKRRCQNARRSTLEHQQQKEALEAETAEKLREYTKRLEEAQQQLQLEKQKRDDMAAEHERKVHELEQQIQHQKEEARVLAAQIHKTPVADEKEDGDGPSNRDWEQLKAELEDKNATIESMEMQLLELERERDELMERAGGNEEAEGADARPSLAEFQALQSQLDEAQKELKQHKLELVQALRRQRHDHESAEQQEQNDAQEHEHAKETIKALEAQLSALKIESEREQEHVGALTRQLASVMEENQSLHQQQQQSQQASSSSSSLIAKVSSAILTSSVTSNSSSSTSEGGDGSVADGLTPEQHATLGRSYVKELEWNGTGKNVRKDDDSGSCWMGRYTGYVNRRGHPDGPGTLRAHDGAIVDSADWKDGQPNGPTVLAGADGDVFRGTFVAGDKHGFGVYVWCDGRVYRGEYRSNTKHGHGVLTWPHGAWFEGPFENDKRNGTGEYHYSDGRVYKGEYVDDVAHGRGILTGRNGAVIYDGIWELGAFREDDGKGAAAGSGGNGAPLQSQAPPLPSASPRMGRC